MKILYFSAVGQAAAPLLDQTLQRLSAHHVEAHLVYYEDLPSPAPVVHKLVQDRGSKWSLARKYLRPEMCAAYDYIFVWDDDIGIGDFDPRRFVQIMEANHLKMAQPSIRSPYPVAHPITIQRPLTYAQRADRIVGRLTNFVEIMVPVFSREGWTEFHSVLEDSNVTGWGYDYLPISPRAVVDCMYVIHTRPVRSNGPHAFEDLNRTLCRLGLSQYPHHELGLLREEPAIAPNRERKRCSVDQDAGDEIPLLSVVTLWRGSWTPAREQLLEWYRTEHFPPRTHFIWVIPAGSEAQSHLEDTWIQAAGSWEKCSLEILEYPTVRMTMPEEKCYLLAALFSEVFAKAESTYVLCVQDDVVPFLGAAKRMVTCFGKLPKPAALLLGVYPVGPRPSSICAGNPSGEFLPWPDAKESGCLEVEWCGSGFTLCHREALGGLTPFYATASPDLEDWTVTACGELRRIGWRIFASHDIRVTHQIEGLRTLEGFHGATVPMREVAFKPEGLGNFEGLRCRKFQGELEFEDFGGYESRNPSMIRLIAHAVEKYPTPDFDWFYVYTGDLDVPRKIHRGHPMFGYCSSRDDYSQVCPDFNFDGWRQTGLDDYDNTATALGLAGMESPETDQLGWRGNFTHENRRRLVAMADHPWLDVERIDWNRADPDRLTCANFVSLEDSARKWRFLIDVEGVGYSGRLKLLLFSRRVLFIQERPLKEWFMPSLVPWEHYVPVERDLSDLIDRLEMLRNDTTLEEKIRQNAYAFATNHLTREHALLRWHDLLQAHAMGKRRAGSPV